MFENSKCIGFISEKSTGNPCTTPAPYIAKTFTLDNIPVRATLNVSSIGDAAYFMNGKRINGVIRPTFPSNPTKSLIYNTFEVANMLCKGNNRFGAIIGSFRVNNGQSGFHSPLMLILELELIFSDGSRQVIVSDESFRGTDSNILFTASTCGERQDARLEIPNWCSPDFDDSSWNHVTLLTMPAEEIRSTTCPLKKITDERSFTEITPKLFDCGITTSGYARLKITGKSGTLIRLKYSERLLPDRKHVDMSAYIKWKFPEMYNCDEYILDGTQNKVFDQYMAFHGFRYVEVEGDYDNIELTAVTVHTDIKQTSFFACDNEIINKIHDACCNSIKTCCQDYFVDTPKRDAPWIGDAMLSSEVITSEFDAFDVLKESAMLCREAKRDNGEIPYCIPSTAFKKFFSGPDWGASFVFQAIYWHYKYFGDINPFLEFKADLDKSLSFFKSISDEDGYIGDPEYATGDWSAIHGSPIARADIMSNVYYCWDAEMMAELSEIAGFDRSEYDKISKKIKSAFRARYMKDNTFEEVSVTELITLAARRFFTEEEIPAVVERIVKHIEDDNHLITFGVHGLKMIFDLLSDHGYDQLLFDTVTNANGLGYAKNVLDGMTCLAERFDWEGNGIFSCNHHFFSMISTWFFRSLAGIKINDFASNDIVISPSFVNGINTLSAEFVGIKVSYDKTNIHIHSPYRFKLVYNGKETIMTAGDYSIAR